MTQQDTQPPAETLAERANSLPWTYAEITTAIRAAREEADQRLGVRWWALEEISRVELILAALTRRAGGDAIPAGWQLVPIALPDEMAIAGAKGRQNSAISSFRDGWKYALAATPKPPAGGDAGAVGWQASTEAGRKVYDHYVGGATQGYLYDHVKRGRLGVMKPDRSHDTAYAAWMAGQHLAALALPAPVVEGWQDIETASRDCITEIDMWCASAEANGEGWNLRGILMVGTPDWIKREDGSDYFPHENGGFLTHWRPVPVPPAAILAALSEGRSHG